MSSNKDEEIGKIIERINKPKEKRAYVNDKNGIITLLRRAFKERKQVKISYYSFSSDEVTNRIIDIYQILRKTPQNGSAFHGAVFF